VVELPGVDVIRREGPERIEYHPEGFALVVRQRGEGKHQVLAYLAQEHPLGERGVQVGIRKVWRDSRGVECPQRAQWRQSTRVEFRERSVEIT
jgi:hypothetical protein